MEAPGNGLLLLRIAAEDEERFLILSAPHFTGVHDVLTLQSANPEVFMFFHGDIFPCSTNQLFCLAKTRV